MRCYPCLQRKEERVLLSSCVSVAPRTISRFNIRAVAPQPHGKAPTAPVVPHPRRTSHLYAYNGTRPLVIPKCSALAHPQHDYQLAPRWFDMRHGAHALICGRSPCVGPHILIMDWVSGAVDYKESDLFLMSRVQTPTPNMVCDCSTA
jgi:hypothetical protein